MYCTLHRHPHLPCLTSLLVLFSSGETVKLTDLLDEARDRACAVLDGRETESGEQQFDADEKAAIARAVGKHPQAPT